MLVPLFQGDLDGDATQTPPSPHKKLRTIYLCIRIKDVCNQIIISYCFFFFNFCGCLPNRHILTYCYAYKPGHVICSFGEKKRKYPFTREVIILESLYPFQSPWLSLWFSHSLILCHYIDKSINTLWKLKYAAFLQLTFSISLFPKSNQVGFCSLMRLIKFYLAVFSV